jgi:hypothetical protein
MSEGDCLLYGGRLSDRGYAQVWIDGRTIRLHRHVYAEHYGPIPEGLEIHHTCGVKHCLNPAHLRAMTHADHMRLHDPLDTAGQRDKPYCKHGHPRTPENLYLQPNGWRACRICKREARRKAAHA